MTFTMLNTFLACAGAVLLFAADGLRAGEGNGKPEKAVQDFLNDKKADAPITPITDEMVTKAFPDRAFFAVVFRQYSIARVAPKPFKAQNIFVVPKNGKLMHLSDTKGLKTFFKDYLPTVKDDDAAKQAARAWLVLSQTFRQDGFFKFAVSTDGLKVTDDKDERKVKGRFVVTQGGKGELIAILTFDANGKLTEASEENRIKPGVRPICQATKLLDADPLVRRMAEQDILVMGQACKGYLGEQRKKVSPKLQKAIDRMWQRIIAEGW